MKSIIDLTSYKQIPDEALQKSARLFSQQGVLQINGALDPRLLKKTRAYFETHYIKPGEQILRKQSSEVYNNRYLTPVSMEGELNRPELYAPSKVMPILQALLGPGFVLHAFGAITAFPGALTQPLHMDHARLFPESNTLDAFFPTYAIHLSIPLIDLDETTGTTAVWEGSHRKNISDPDELEEDKTEPLKGASLPYTKLGGCLLTDFRLYHRGVENRSLQPRPFLYMVFCRSWFNDSSNYPKKRRLKMTNAEFKKVPKEYRFLFSQHKVL